jgi:thiol:disulfide interchange protein DsbA
MKQIAIASAVLLLLLAGWFFMREPAPATGTPERQAAIQAESAALVAEQDAVSDDEVQPQMVEESAAEEDEAEAGDQPIMLAQADTSATSRDWQFTDGTHFTRLVPTQPTIGGADKIEVAEIFWYGCGHCFDFEPYINRWAENLPANVRFVRIPAMWNALVKLHGQLYFTEEVLVKNGKIADPAAFRTAVFLEYHRRGNRLASVDVIRSIFERFGVSVEDFDSTWGSFEVAQKMRVAEDLARRWSVASVPAVVVNGKYLTGGGQAGSYPKLIELINELVERESVR